MLVFNFQKHYYFVFSQVVIIGTLKIDSAVCLIYSFNLVLDASLYSPIYGVNTSVPTLYRPVILEHQDAFPWKVGAESSSEGAHPPHIGLVYKK